MSAAYDAVVIGAGPNGLVAANHLMDAGWSVVVLEARPDIGGAVASDREVHPGFVHDTFSAFYPLAAASATIRGFELDRHGLEWVHAPAVLGHLMPDSDRWAVLHRDREVTAAMMDDLRAGDGDAWLQLCARWDRIGPAVVDALLTPFPPVRAGLSAVRRLPSVGGLSFVRELLTPVADFARQRFAGPGPQLLLCGNAGHADIPLNAPGSGLMGLLMTMLGQTVGFPVPRGGAGELAQALGRRLRAGGAEVLTGQEVVAIQVVRDRARGVRTATGDHYAASHAVIADVAAPTLYGRLLPAAALPSRVRSSMRTFEMDPGTVKVDWALDGPVPWRVPPPYAAGTVHVADSVEQMAEALHQVSSQTVPSRPFLLTGQMTTADPTRSPVGTESLWAYTHVPQQVARDAGDDGLRGSWDATECERFADRMQARMEELAPGFGDLVAARRVLGPRELEARNANLIGGGVNGGTAQLHQQLVFRPVPGLGRAETPVRGVFLGSAAAHPGGGVHGACGMNAARAAILHRRVSRLTPR